jgi:uncharacterized oligopeptide transporter (OPT) family protein
MRRLPSNGWASTSKAVRRFNRASAPSVVKHYSPAYVGLHRLLGVLIMVAFLLPFVFKPA